MKRFVFFVFTLSFLLPLSAREYRTVPNVGHSDRINALLSLREDRILSLGEDQLCLVIDPSSSRVINRFSFDGIPLMVALNPNYSDFALLSERGGSFTITVYDWQTGKKRFTLEETGIPFYMDYSRSGDILFYGSSTRPVVMADRAAGAELEFPDKMAPLLTFGYMGGTDKTFMGYKPSGEFLYYDRFSSQLKGSVKVTSDLTDITVLQSAVQYVTARKGDEVLLINRQTGAVQDRIEEEGIIHFSCSPDDGTVTLLCTDGEGYRFCRYQVNGARFISRNKIELDDGDYSATLYHRGKSYLASAGGEIFRMTARGIGSSLFSALPLRLEEMAVVDGRFLLRSREVLWEWLSPFFSSSEPDINKLLNLSKSEWPLPFPGGKFSLFQDDVLLWKPDKEKDSPIYILNREDMAWSRFYSPPEEEDKGETPFFDGEREKNKGIISLSYRGDREVILGGNKSCTINEIVTGESDEIIRDEIYRYQHPSLEAAALVSDDLLAMGRNTFYGGQDPLTVINIANGESVLIEDERDVVTRILPDGEDIFYTLGFLTEDEESVCLVKEHRIEDNRLISRSLFSYPEEINGESQLYPGPQGSIYLKRQDLSLVKLDGVAPSYLDVRSAMPILYHNGYLYVIDRDNSLLIFEERELKPLARLYAFENGQWLAQSFLGDFYIYSEKARDYFSVFRLE